jgi:hypothetical protein
MAVLFRKGEVGAKSVPDIVTVKDKGPASGLMQPFFHHMRQGGLAGAGKAGKPDYDASVLVLLFPAAPGHSCSMSNYVWTFHVFKKGHKGSRVQGFKENII